MDEKKTNVTVSFGSLATLLTVAFVVLKLCGVITWSWIWVISPLWISVAIALGLIIIITIISLIAAIILDR